MNTRAQTPRNALVHIMVCTHHGFAESLYRACSWLVDVQGVLQTSDFKNYCEYRFVQCLQETSRTSFIKTSANTSEDKIIHAVDVCGLLTLLDLHAHMCPCCIHCVGTLCTST